MAVAAAACKRAPERAASAPEFRAVRTVFRSLIPAATDPTHLLTAVHLVPAPPCRALIAFISGSVGYYVYAKKAGPTPPEYQTRYH